jgi:hypothetical protein
MLILSIGMKKTMIEAAALAAGILLFLTGFYTGLWVQRHSYTDREVPKLIPTERVVEVEKPVIVQVPVQPKPGGASLAIMNNGNPKTNVLNPNQKAEADRMSDLLTQMPEL